MGLLHKSKNAQVQYLKMNHFIAEYVPVCIFMSQNDALWVICMIHCGLNGMGIVGVVLIISWYEPMEAF